MKIFRYLALLMLFSLLSACASTQRFDTSTAEGSFALAEKYQSDGRFEEAINQFNDVRNRHPYSRLAVEARLRVADIHFARKSFAEAQAAYQVFKELHPRHPRIDYVTFQLGMSYFNQLPSTIDRDLSLASQAMLFFSEVQRSFPQSEYVEQAKAKHTELEKMLAEKEHYIAHFYFIRRRYQSALGRFERLWRQHQDLGFDLKALYGAAVSAHRIQDYEKADYYLKILSHQFPEAPETYQAQQELARRS